MDFSRAWHMLFTSMNIYSKYITATKKGIKACNIKFSDTGYIYKRPAFQFNSWFGRFRETWIYLAAVISSQTAKQESGDTSEKQEAIIANSDQHRSFAFVSRASPGFFCLSHSARSPKSSIGTIVLLSGMEDISLFPEANPFDTEGLVFFLANCMLFRTVSIWVLSRGSLNSLDA